MPNLKGLNIDQLNNENGGLNKKLIARESELRSDQRKVQTENFRSIRNLEGRKLSVIRSLLFMKFTFGGLLIFCFASFLWGIIQNFVPGRASVKEDVTSTITAYMPQYRVAQRKISADGAISAWESIAISPEINGLRIENVLVKEGDHVKSGQVLACLDNSVLKAELQEARAELLASKASLTKSIQPNRAEEIASLKAALAQAHNMIAQAKAVVESTEARYLNAKEIAERYIVLQKMSAVTEVEARNSYTEATALHADLTKAEQQVEAAKESCKQAQERLKLAVAGGRKEDISVSEAVVLEAQAKVGKLEALLSQATIRSPENGLVVKSSAHHGEVPVAGQPIFYLVRDSRLELKVGIPETELLLLHAGQTAQIRARRSAGPVILGKVREVSPSVDATSRLGFVYIAIPENVHVVPGMFFHVDINVASDRILTIPKEAILDSDGQSYVFLIEGNRVRKIIVETGDDFDNYIEIKSGLQTGQKIAVSGAPFLKDGDQVNIVD